MFNGIKLSTFLSTPEEWHAFLIGFFEVLCPWRARIELLTDANNYLKGEYHYYVAGRALGAIALVFILIAIACIVKEVLL